MHKQLPGTNDIPILVTIDGETCSHFRLREFQNPDGLTMIHRTVLDSLERVRRDLCAAAAQDVYIIITDALRTAADNKRLASKLGWTDDGGAVSRHSKHLAAFGGIAVDLVARITSSHESIPQPSLATVCRRHFDWVKGDYPDGHVHADNRTRAV